MTPLNHALFLFLTAVLLATPPGHAADAAWPASQEGLAFAFATAHFRSPVIAFDQAGARLTACEFAARGRARHDRNYAMVTSGGSFTVPFADAWLLTACRTSGALSLEAYLTPLAAAFDQVGEIVSFSTDAKARNFALVQDHGKLVLLLRTSADKNPAGQAVELYALPAGKPVHVAVTYANGALACYLDGKEVPKGGQPVGDFGNWEAAHLFIGDGWSADRNWPGTIEGIALFARVLKADEVAQDAAAYAAKVAGRKPVPELRIKGRLLARSKVPEAKEIAPYFQALATYEYAVEQVIAGSYDGATIRVAHWGMMEKTILPIANRPIGEQVELQLEPMEANRQLESQWLADTLEPADLPLFYDVSRP